MNNNTLSDKSIQEILKEEAVESCLTATQKMLVLNAMQTYADQEKRSTAIAFAQFIQDNSYGQLTDDTYCSLNDGPERYTGDELYDLYITHSLNNIS